MLESEAKRSDIRKEPYATDTLAKIAKRSLQAERLASVVGQIWRDGRVQVTLARFLRSEEVEIVSLDEHLARSCGEFCAAAGSTDVIDASVVILAKERRDPIVTSDPSDLKRLDPGAEIIPI